MLCSTWAAALIWFSALAASPCNLGWSNYQLNRWGDPNHLIKRHPRWDRGTWARDTELGPPVALLEGGGDQGAVERGEKEGS